jgi:thioredoxin reductase (NADPH)
MPFEIKGLETTAQGQIITDNYCRTNIKGLYAVGDIREREVYQIITAVADGALVIEGILKE